MWTCWSQCRGGHGSVKRDEPFCEDMLRELEKRRLWVNLIMAFQYLKGTYKKAEEKLLTELVATGQGIMVLNRRVDIDYIYEK